jgi:hypothetical protein
VSKHPADLIIGSLGSEHLYGLLPGNDRQAAVSRLVASKHYWSGPGYAALGGRRTTALTFVTWAEALAIIERGCADGHRERYEAAHRAWCAGVREAYARWRPDADWFPATPAADAIQATTAALIRHGAGLTTVQDPLF